MKRLLLLLALLAAPAQAEEAGWTHALAMHGQPKYAEGFQHLDYVNPDAPRAGKLRLAATGGFDSLHAHIALGKPAANLYLVHDSLMARVWDEPFSLYPLIAEAVKMPEDRSFIAFRLDPRARFQDGTPITVQDVLWTFETLRDKGRPNTRTTYAKIAKTEITGEREVTFTMGPAADRETPLILAMMPVLDKAWWQGRDFTQPTLDVPVGSGPYKIAKMTPGQSITLQRVEYWAKDLPVMRGQDNFDTIETIYFKDDRVALESLRRGDVDFRREGDPATWDTGYDIPARAEGQLKLVELPHGRPEPAKGFVFNERRALFADPRVRHALILALDFDWMNKTYFHGAYRRIGSLYPNSELAAQGEPTPAELSAMEPLRADLPADAFGPAWTPPKTDGSGPRGLRANIEAAQKLLTAAGWSNRGGVLTGPKGEPFAFELLLGDPSDERVALAYRDSLSRLGIKATVRTVDSVEFTGRLEAFDFNSTLIRWISTLSPGAEQAFYFGSKAADTKGSRNYPGIKDKAVDALAAGIATAKDREGLVAGARALDRAVAWGWHFAPLGYLGKDLVAYRAGLAFPPKPPLYGLVLETWWREP